MNQPQQPSSAPRSNSQRTHQPRRRGTRGGGRKINSNSPRTSTSSEGTAQTIHDPAARQQMKQTMAIALMTNPAIPLPFPLATILGVAMLTYPNAKEKEKEPSA
ncbi:hypothetical protein N0V84_002059 [Fusarium piperis]|uniref:Uncharacterized protein n=1 Tax=Fusarium piperis TaxID=1435070 RepID=A0A9W8WK34_9HYPO|nr:hypothetical protein N0V84_002059 [Fusarium piperis]